MGSHGAYNIVRNLECELEEDRAHNPYYNIKKFTKSCDANGCSAGNRTLAQNMWIEQLDDFKLS